MPSEISKTLRLRSKFSIPSLETSSQTKISIGSLNGGREPTSNSNCDVPKQLISVDLTCFDMVNIYQ